MSVLANHIVLMFIYAAAAALFFALLWKDDQRERIRTFVLVFSSLFIGGLVIAWLMFPLPKK